MQQSKPWYKSKTIIFNAVMGTLIAAEQSMGALEPVLGAAAFGVLTFALPVGNVLLRMITSAPVSSK